MVLQNSALISQRDLKLALRFVMRYRTAVHATLLLRFFLQILRDCRPGATISSDATFAPRAAATPAGQVPCATGLPSSATRFLAGHVPARHASK
jgi:hypothetical protein